MFGGRTQIALIAGLAAGFTASADAQLLFSFEDGVQDWEYAGFSSQPGSVAVSTNFATEGSQSLAITQNISGFSWTATIDFFNGKQTDAFNALIAAAANPNAEIAYDITYDPASTPSAYTFVNNSFSVQAPDFLQIDGVGLIGSGALDNGPVTLTVQEPLSSFNVDPSSTFARLTLGLNGDWGRAPLTVYLDNVRIVPEPASAGLLGLAGLALLRRR
ncbi:PEP-CTERM sorting domain-containing protein [Mucisphaera sp.]|uniref:PEP-CTERM sorting domain-containing protein n=1 Tax=Mucisphaera sp. TaxID=2913024 RepID=UPI003D1361DD